MPRPRRRATQVVPLTKRREGFTASAARVNGLEQPIVYNIGDGWQKEAYRQHQICGEAAYAAGFYAHAFSKATLYATVKGERQDAGAVHDALAVLFAGRDDEAAILSAIGLHWTIAGECYLVGRKPQPADFGLVMSEEEAAMLADDTLWEVVSVMEMQHKTDTWWIQYDGTGRRVDLEPDDTVIRLWLPDPVSRARATSPFRPLLPVLSEIEQLTKHIYAQIRSRLAGAGIYWVPSEMDFPDPPEQGDEGQPVSNATSFMLDLGAAMMETVNDQSAPGATIPYIATAPGQMIGQAHYQTFWTELDQHALELRTEAIRRFALGMNLPPEEILGMSSNGGTGGGTSNGVSHWGAWQIEESTIKMHIEPDLDTLANCLAIAYLQIVTGNPDAGVGYDTGNMKLRPDRSKESIELYNLGLVGSEVVLRENGFDIENDPMGEEEFQRWLTTKVASGSATPEMVASALEDLGVELEVVPEPTNLREARPDPTLEDHPQRPRTPGEAAALVTACEALTLRALERAGNRLKALGVKPPGCKSYEVHTMAPVAKAEPLLVDAWSTADIVLDGIAEPADIVPTLNAFVTSLLTQGQPYQRARLTAWLNAREESA